MYDLSWKITVGNYRLTMLDSAKIMRSVEQLSDTAEIVLPGSCFNKAIEIEGKISRGSFVEIKAGYDGSLTTEFEGYVESISTDDGTIKLNCEDAIFQFRRPVADKEFNDPDVQDILKYICSQLSGFTLNCDYSFKYDKFVIGNNTGYDILKKIQEETKANVYVKGKELHVHPQYKEIFGSVKYSFQDNIEKSELEYKDSRDRVVEIVVEGKGKDGKVIREKAGSTGGDQINIKIDGVSDTSTLKKLAEEQLKIKSYTGYSGSFTGWLVPYCDAGYKASISDKDYEFKNGDYYVLGVETTISSAGGVRKITVGMKI
jgi:phage protein D